MSTAATAENAGSLKPPSWEWVPFLSILIAILILLTDTNAHQYSFWSYSLKVFSFAFLRSVIAKWIIYISEKNQLNINVQVCFSHLYKAHHQHFTPLVFLFWAASGDRNSNTEVIHYVQWLVLILLWNLVSRCSMFSIFVRLLMVLIVCSCVQPLWLHGNCIDAIKISKYEICIFLLQLTKVT